MTDELTSGQPSPASSRDRLLLGEPLHFQPYDPEPSRTLDAEWITLAVARQARIDVSNAIVVGSLQLQYSVLENELNLEDCRVMEKVDFSYATFKRNLILSGTKFEQGLDLHGATLDHDAFLGRASILAGSAQFHDIQFKGVCVADWLTVGDGVETNFNRTRFERTGRFLNCLFGGEVSFRGAHFGDQAAFQGATFKSKTSFNGAIIGQHALFRDQPNAGAGNTTFEGPIDFSGAQISGDADFQNAIFKEEANFVGTEFMREVVFSGALLKQKLDLSACVIAGTASFQGDDSIGLPAAVCEGKVYFSRARVGALDCRGVLFKDEVALSLATVGGTASFNGKSQPEGRAAVFEAKANFGNARIVGQADFQGVEFKQEVSFNLAKLEGGSFFRQQLGVPGPGARFGGAADFIQTHFGGIADFKGVVFSQDVTFSGAHFEGAALFFAAQTTDASAAVFEGNASFMGVRIAELDMTGAKFRKNASFSRLLVSGSTTFGAASFDGDADFTGAHFGRDVSFHDAAFPNQTTFSTARFDGDAFFNRAIFKKGGETDFRGAHFAGVADFKGTIFESEVDFYAVHGDRLTRFEDGVFQNSVGFRESSFTALHFSAKNESATYRQFQGNVDLVGCTYEHIQVDLPSLIEHLDPFDRQPYTQLEFTLRTSGDDREADKVYLARQHRERMLRLDQNDLSAWLFSTVYWWIANYGVRPYRLIVAAVLLLTLGTYYFSIQGTAFPKEQAASPPGLASAKQPATPAPSPEAPKLSTLDAFGVSLHQFLPVDVPLGSDWKPSDSPANIALPGIGRKLPFPLNVPTFFATFFLRLAGWILVPLGVAALTGLLRIKP